MKYFISVLTTYFLFYSLCKSQETTLTSIDNLFLMANLQLSNKPVGKFHYTVSIKYFQSPTPEVFHIQLLYNKNNQSLDSISDYIINIDNKTIHIAHNSKLNIANINTKSIDVYSIDTLYTKTFSKLISGTGRHLFRPLVSGKKLPLVVPRDYLYQSVEEIVLNGLEYFKVSFASLDTLNTNYGYDSTIYHFKKNDYSLYKYERVLYDTSELNTQILVYDQIIRDSTFIESTLDSEHYLDSLQNQNYSVNVIDPYGDDIDPLSIMENQKVPNWKVLDKTGGSIELKSIKSKLILFDFSYLSCTYCMKSLPMLNDLFKLYNRNDLTVCWINPYDFEKKEFVSLQFEKRNIEFPVYYDIEKLTAKEYGINSYPQLFLVESGTLNLIKSIGGYNEINKSILIETIEKYLNK